MRKVAKRLGTGAASLYAYVSGKDELLELVFDDLAGQVTLPEPDPAIWRDQLRGILRQMRTILAAHRDAALAGLGRIPTSPNTLAVGETIVALLRAGGLSDRVVALGLDQLILYVSACAFETGLYEQSGMTTDELERYFEDIEDFYSTLPADRFPVLASISADVTEADGDDRFEFGLGVLIAGLETVSAAERESEPPRGH
jgi:AcrR family transcriptional regulator